MSNQQNDTYNESKQEAEEEKELKPFASNGKFEDFLMNEHAKEYHGTDDNMPDAFDNWLTELSADDFIMYADSAIAKALKEKADEIPF